MKITSSYFRIALALILIIIAFTILRNQTLAQSASNNSYIIQGGEIEQKTFTNSGDSSTESFDKSSDKTTNIYFGENYQVTAGFEEIEDNQPFSFSVSNTLIDYGLLTPTNPVSRTTDLIISKGSSRGYSVFAFANRQLSDVNNNSIPDTTCDNGTCSETSSAQWSGNLSFGFGYRCENSDSSGCTGDFSKADYFKQFANDSKSKQYQAIINSFDSGKAKIEYKVNISNNQAKSSYSNSITFIAIPNL